MTKLCSCNARQTPIRLLASISASKHSHLRNDSLLPIVSGYTQLDMFRIHILQFSTFHNSVLDLRLTEKQADFPNWFITHWEIIVSQKT